jgi:hypothetical protein
MEKGNHDFVFSYGGEYQLKAILTKKLLERGDGGKKPNAVPGGVCRVGEVSQ